MKKRNRQAEESLSYTAEVADKEGQVIQRISSPSRSYVEQWNQLINSHASTENKTIKDTDGVDRGVPPYYASFDITASIAEIRYGIRVGKGSTAVVIDDYALETPCDEGTDPDQFNHQVMQFTEPSVAGPTCSFTATRVMVNNSGATIGVREIGSYMRCRDGAATYRFLLGFRDVLPSTLSIPDGGSITVTYTLKVTV